MSRVKSSAFDTFEIENVVVDVLHRTKSNDDKSSDFFSETVEEACIIALHEIFAVNHHETFSDVLVADSNALLAADKLNVPAKVLSSHVRPENSSKQGWMFVNGFSTETRSVLCSNQESDINNNFGSNCNSSIVCTDSIAHSPRSVSDNPPHSTVSIILNEDVRSTSVSDAQPSILQPPAVSAEQGQKNDDEMSDMSIDIDNEDLDGADLIHYVAPEAEVSNTAVSKDPGYTTTVSHADVNAREVISTQDEGEPPQKAAKMSVTVSSSSSSTSASASSSSSQTDSSELQSSSGTTCSTCSDSTSDVTNSETRSASHSSSKDSVAHNSKVPNVSDDGPSGAHITRPSPTRATAAISVWQTRTGRTSDGLIDFAEAVGQTGKASSAAASLRSSRLAERSSLADRNNSRPHPYRPVQKANQRRPDMSRNFFLKQYKAHKSIQDLLDCHTTYAYRQRQLSKQPVNPRVLLELPNPSEKPAFGSYRFVRATRVAAQRILGETDVVDDLEDVIYTQDDIRNFGEKKRLAHELDKAVENISRGDS